MDYRELKRKIKRKVKEAHKQGAVINCFGIGGAANGKIIKGNTYCLLSLFAIEHPDYVSNYSFYGAKVLDISLSQADALEKGFFSCNEKDYLEYRQKCSKDKKMTQIGFELKQELVKEGIYTFESATSESRWDR